MKAEVARLAAGKFADVDIVYKVMNLDDVKVDLDSGTVKGVEESLKALEEQHPWMLSKGSKVTTTSTTNPSNPTGKPMRTDDQRYADYFGKAANEFWDGGGVRTISEED